LIAESSSEWVSSPVQPELQVVAVTKETDLGMEAIELMEVMKKTV